MQLNKTHMAKTRCKVEVLCKWKNKQKQKRHRAVTHKAKKVSQSGPKKYNLRPIDLRASKK
jgi:hypothetical protein